VKKGNDSFSPINRLKYIQLNIIDADFFSGAGVDLRLLYKPLKGGSACKQCTTNMEKQ
jgi:hypothetical protein